MLQNAYSLAKIGADTAENERNFAANLPKIWDGRPPERATEVPAAGVEEVPRACKRSTSDLRSWLPSRTLGDLSTEVDPRGLGINDLS